ncbi:MAG: arylsulfatase [Verrucomicrobia bacterium]|nr:arylsulfatase [Verrucomicrobiota bacterium]
MLGLVAWTLATTPAAAVKPNLIFIMADDLGYGDIGCYGQKIIQTPRLDRMASEGLRFTQFYAGSTVCAPSRCVLMTGKHMGHSTVRGNGQGPEQALKDDDVTVAEALKPAGYATALIGKWGLGDMRPGTDVGIPTRQGFDYFYGYLNQVHAHNYYPTFLWRNEEMAGLRNQVRLVAGNYGGFRGGAATKRIDYSHDLLAAESLDWIRAHKDGPFFLYLSLTIPHANNEGSGMFGNGAEVPDFGPYKDRDWPDQDKGQAAMISRMDADVGRILDLLTELRIEENTLVIFTSDNGPHNEARHNPERFNPAGPLRGMKRDLYEGGIRVPTIAWWPKTIKAGGKSDHIGYFGDLMATACELAGVQPAAGLDSISFLPVLKGDTASQKQHAYLYWEFYERGGRRAVRAQNWKAVRPLWNAKIELYDLENDLSEHTDVAQQHPNIVNRMAAMMEEAHIDSPDWPVPAANARN